MQGTSWVIAGLLLYVFFQSYSTQQRLDNEIHNLEHSTHHMEVSIRVRLHREQRNMYLCGFTLFHGLFLWRLVKFYDRVDAGTKKLVEAQKKAQ